MSATIAGNWRTLLRAAAPGCSILIRLLVGLVGFLPEGLLSRDRRQSPI
jgi:hypothetical protein